MRVPIFHLPSPQERSKAPTNARPSRNSSTDVRRRCQCILIISAMLVRLIFSPGPTNETAFASDRHRDSVQSHGFSNIGKPTEYHIGAVRFVVPRFSPISYNLATDRSPFMVNASLFVFQGATLFAILTIVRCTEQASFLSRRLRRCMLAYLVITVVSGSMYVRFSLNRNVWMVELADGESWIIDRCACWAILTPIQWYIFCESCTRAHKADLIHLGVTAALTQIFGVGFFCVRPLAASVVVFVLSCCTFVLMFRKAYTVTLLPDIAHISRMVRVFTLVLWLIYPSVAILRHVGVISAWKEQVLLYSILDIATKSLTFSYMIIIRFAFSMTGMQGNVLLLLAANDLILKVDNGFHVLDTFRALPLAAFHFGDVLDKHSLLELCVADEDRQRLRDAAWSADGQPLDALISKCRVAFRLPNDEDVFYAELHVSKRLRGQRFIGVMKKAERQHLEQDGIPDETESCSSVDRASVYRGLDHDGPETTEEHPERVSSLRLVLSLQNCMSVLELTFGIREMLCGVFVSRTTPVGLFFWDGQSCTEAAGPAIVAMSPMLESICGIVDTPAPLVPVLGENAVTQILSAIRIFELVLFQVYVRLPDSRNCRVTVLPLRRLSGPAAASGINLCLFLIEPELSNAQADSDISPRKYFWYSTGAKQPVCIRCESPSSYIAPPMIADLSYPVRGACKWLLFYENDFGPLGIPSPRLHIDERTSARLAFALPADVPLKAALSVNYGAATITTDIENTLITALSMGALDCQKSIPSVLYPLVDASCRRGAPSTF